MNRLILVFLITFQFTISSIASDDATNGENNNESANTVDNHYSFINYESMKFDGATTSFSGFSFGGSVEINPSVLFGASYVSTSASSSSGSVTISGGTIGVSYAHEIDQSSDIIFGINYLSSTISGSGYLTQTTTNTGFGLAYKRAVSSSGEFSLSLQSVDGNNTFGFGYEAKINSKLSIRGGYATADNISGFSIGLKLYEL